MRYSVALFAFASVSAAAGLARAQSGPVLDLQGEGVGLAMRLSTSSADQPRVSSQADLTGQLDHLQTRLQLGLETGRQGQGAAPESGWWSSTDAHLGAVWTPLPMARIEVAALSVGRLEFSSSDPVFADGAQRYAEDRKSGFSASADLTPFSPLDLRLGARVSSNLQQTAYIAGTGAETADLVQTDARQLSAALVWRPWSAARVEAGGRLDSTGLVWSAGRAASYDAIDPAASLSIDPWSGGLWRVSLDRSSTPLSADQFVGYGEGGATAALAGIQSSREWRYGMALTQKAGPLDLSASVLQARVQAYAYLAPSGALAARTGLGQGDRSEIKAGFAAPLPVLGLSPFTVRAAGTWRTSAVQDPLTGALGPLSGERPYDASLTLSQTLGGLRWGMTAQTTGPQRTLGTTQVTSLSPSAGLGGFFEYHVRLVVLQLSLDNLVGGEREQRDVVYAGSRDLDIVDHTDQTRTVDRAVRISLIRPL